MSLATTSPRCYLVSDLHGSPDRYRALVHLLREDPPNLLFLGGDLLPSVGRDVRSLNVAAPDFVNGYLVPTFRSLQRDLGPRHPQVFVILGNDDPRFHEASMLAASAAHVWKYVHNRRVFAGNHAVYGYACIPPSPFRNKDWERYDVSRYVDPGCVSPEEGSLSVPRSARDRRYATIAHDLKFLTDGDDLSASVLLTHVPPYNTALDTADLAGRCVDGVPVDVHVGSIALRRLIEARAPLVTLHGHVHEAHRITGVFKEQVGRTWCLSAAGDEEGLVVVDFRLGDPGAASRRVVEAR